MPPFNEGSAIRLLARFKPSIDAARYPEELGKILIEILRAQAKDYADTVYLLMQHEISTSPIDTTAEGICEAISQLSKEHGFALVDLVGEAFAEFGLSTEETDAAAYLTAVVYSSRLGQRILEAAPGGSA